MNIDPHWLEVCVVTPALITSLGIGGWFLRRIMKSTDTLPVLVAKFDAHTKLDDERFEDLKEEIRDIRGGLTPPAGQRLPRRRA